jgi:hypothetical protein
VAKETRPSNADAAAEIGTAIKKEAVGYVAKAVVVTAAGVIGIAGLGLWIYVKQFLPEVAGGVPRGAVVAFDRDDLGEDKCPSGWAPFLEARARTIVGAGNPQHTSGMGIDDHQRPLQSHFLRERGGEQVAIQAQQFAVMSAAQPHNNLVPYIALYYCKKE